MRITYIHPVEAGEDDPSLDYILSHPWGCVKYFLCVVLFCLRNVFTGKVEVFFVLFDANEATIVLDGYNCSGARAQERIDNRIAFLCGRQDAVLNKLFGKVQTCPSFLDGGIFHTLVRPKSLLHLRGF